MIISVHDDTKYTPLTGGIGFGFFCNFKSVLISHEAYSRFQRYTKMLFCLHICVLTWVRFGSSSGGELILLLQESRVWVGCLGDIT